MENKHNGKTQKPRREFPIEIALSAEHLFAGRTFRLKLQSGLTIFVGPNGSGKSQLMRCLESKVKEGQQEGVRYLSADRFGMLQDLKQLEQAYPDTKSVSLPVLPEGDAARRQAYSKASWQLSSLLNRRVQLDWGSGRLRAEFYDGNGTAYPIAAEASGLVHVVSILTALYDESVSMLLIDEPELSLHPQMQSFLLREMQRVAGHPDAPGRKIVIMATHSTEMLKINHAGDIGSIVFFRDNRTLPLQVDPHSEVLRDQKLKELVPRLGYYHKAAFFAEKVLMIEGESDAYVVSSLSDRFDLNLDMAGTQVVPVGGRDFFAPFSKLLGVIGKQPVAVADLDALVDDNSLFYLPYAEMPRAQAQAEELGYAGLAAWVEGLRQECTRCALRQKPPEAVYKDHYYWINRGMDEEGRRIAYKRAVISALMSLPDKDVRDWPKGRSWLVLKRRMEELLELFEGLGCFFLRRGTIESYYLYARNAPTKRKPQESLLEAAWIRDARPGALPGLRAHYGDLLRALEYAADPPPAP